VTTLLLTGRVQRQQQSAGGVAGIQQLVPVGRHPGKYFDHREF